MSEEPTKVLGATMPLAVTVDGALYAAVAIGGAFGGCLNSDEAAKFLEPVTLFWLRTVTVSVTAGLLAVKLYRSTGYAAHVAMVEKKKENEV